MADLDRKNDVFVTKDNKEKNADFSEKTVNIHVDGDGENRPRYYLIILFFINVSAGISYS